MAIRANGSDPGSIFIVDTFCPLGLDIFVHRMTGIGTKSLGVGVFEPKLESKHEDKSAKEEYKTANGNAELPS